MEIVANVAQAVGYALPGMSVVLTLVAALQWMRFRKLSINVGAQYFSLVTFGFAFVSLALVGMRVGADGALERYVYMALLLVGLLCMWRALVRARLWCSHVESKKQA